MFYSDILTTFTDNMDIYLIMIIALAILAIGDLMVGVSNDAVNFLKDHNLNNSSTVILDMGCGDLSTGWLKHWDLQGATYIGVEPAE